MSKPLPALTHAEAELVDRYVRILELLARLNPARTASNTRGCLHAAAALLSEARGLHASLATMQKRGEDELFNDVLSTALQHLDADRQVARLTTSSRRTQGQQPNR